MDLNKEESVVLENYYRDFIRGGANLTEDDKETFSSINGKLSTLSIQFGQNVLNETNQFELVIDKIDDLVGLPESAIANAAETAANNGQKGKWIFTISKPSMIPFIKYSAKRELREKIYSAYFMKGNHNNELDNKNILVKMANLRW